MPAELVFHRHPQGVGDGLTYCVEVLLHVWKYGTKKRPPFGGLSVSGRST